MLVTRAIDDVKKDIIDGEEKKENIDYEKAIATSEINGAQRNAFGLSQLFQGDKISLVCSDKSYDYCRVS